MTITDQGNSMAQPGVYPFIHIEQQPDPDDPTGFQLDVKAGNGVDSTDHIVTVLLLVVEKITGVSPGLYAQEIDIVRRVARGGPPLFPLGAEDEYETDE